MQIATANAIVNAFIGISLRKTVEKEISCGRFRTDHSQA